MKSALDTNIALRFANRQDPQHALVAACVQRASDQGDELCIAAQVLYEFWVVATRPAEVNGLGLPVADAADAVARLRRSFTLLDDPARLVDEWLALCQRHDVKGKPAHDARLVAWMQLHAIARLITLNEGDFARFKEINCLNPAG